MSEFVTFEMAKKLKEKGFSKLCFATYDKDGMLGYNYCQPTTIRAISFEECMSIHGSDDNCIDAPTISQVLKWLRDEKNIICLPHIEPIEEKWFFYVVKLPQASDFPEYLSLVIYNTYEEAALAGIEWVLDNLI